LSNPNRFPASTQMRLQERAEQALGWQDTAEVAPRNRRPMHRPHAARSRSHGSHAPDNDSTTRPSAQAQAQAALGRALAEAQASSSKQRAPRCAKGTRRGTSIFDRLSNPKHFTGTHKQRCVLHA